MILTTPPTPPPFMQPQTVTVWIHGTKAETVLPSAFEQFIQKMSQSFCDSKKGLHKTSGFETNNYAYTLAHALSHTSPAQFPWQNFYSFGWSGKLDPQERKNASHELFNALAELQDCHIKNYGYKPNFVLISHSHGGNVILHMAEINDPGGTQLTIAKVILLACPVQKKTTNLIAHPMFEKIYSLHSHTDLIQIADPQGLHTIKKLSRPILSERHFETHAKMVQACVRWKQGPVFHENDHEINYGSLKKLTQIINLITIFKKNRGLLHIEFKMLPFIRQLPAIIKKLDDCIAHETNCSRCKDDDIIVEL